MKTYKSLNDFAKSFNITDCYKKSFMKRQGGYVFEAVINKVLVDVVITPLDKNNKPVIFSGSLEKKTIQVLQHTQKKHFKIVEK